MQSQFNCHVISTGKSAAAATSNPIHWNTQLKTIADGPTPHRAVATFIEMLPHATPDTFTFSITLKASSRAKSLHTGEQLHALILKSGYQSHIFLQNSLLRLYSRCGRLNTSRQLFDGMSMKDSVTWNTMIDAYAKTGTMMALALALFDEMEPGDRSVVTWNSMISGFAHLGTDDGASMGRILFDEMKRRVEMDSTTWNSMVYGYVKVGRMEDAVALFEEMPEMDRDVVTYGNLVFGYVAVGRIDLGRKVFDEMPMEKDVVVWNTMLSGYVNNGCYLEALRLFRNMTVIPDATTLAAVLSAVAELGFLSTGLSLHRYINRIDVRLDGRVGVGLINMYAKCGRIDRAMSMFGVSKGRNVDHWNAMIHGLAVHGFGRSAIRVFLEMIRCGVSPDDITFIGVLAACSHSGLVEDGLALFDSMIPKFKLEPKVQHYGCVVDLLARSGRVNEAINLIEKMAVNPNDVILRSLLSGCRTHLASDSVGIGRRVFDRTVGRCDMNSYVLLSDIYAKGRLWKDVTKIRMEIGGQDLKKVPGCSWIELDGFVHEFFAGRENPTVGRRFEKRMEVEGKL